jgi:hypothetical protein
MDGQSYTAFLGLLYIVVVLTINGFLYTRAGMFVTQKLGRNKRRIYIAHAIAYVAKVGVELLFSKHIPSTLVWLIPLYTPIQGGWLLFDLSRLKKRLKAKAARPLDLGGEQASSPADQSA